MKKSERNLQHIAEWLIRLGFTLGELGEIITMYAIEDRIKIVKAISRQVR